MTLPENFSLAEAYITNNRSDRVQLAKVGTWVHDEYGKFSITAYDLYRMKQLYEGNVRRQTIDGKTVIPIDYGHATGEEAAGWDDSLSIEPDLENKLSLFGGVDWTPKAAQKIRDKEYKFISPDIRRNYEDKETGKVYDIVLMGAALTNVPFLRDMEAVFLLSEEKQRLFMPKYLSGDDPGNKLNLNQGVSMTVQEIQSAISQASPEDKREIFKGLAKDMESGLMNDNQQLTEKLKTSGTDLEKTKTALKLAEDKIKLTEGGDSEILKKLQLSEQKVGDLSENVESLKKTLARDKKKAEFDKMLLDEKACEAQRESFMKGDITEFAANAEPIKLGETGDNSKGDELKDVEGRIEKLAEKARKEDSDLDYGDSISLVLSENKELNDAYNSL